ncbi:ABC transporter substrate-binding protein [Actinomadura darangshiensis]|uniref:ABC transporter substrate-binding protein n=1 Tax=Actinomadura darangshiensis TaxID=705336 RepID=A0A4R5A0G2_9ACTN|nr:ABC transporter substrate-binding protein [Actinomadura darangshiensis]TDD64094.1 ABC transporter substrate-binding protein [Actinomadura darangshiensis]
MIRTIPRGHRARAGVAVLAALATAALSACAPSTGGEAAADKPLPTATVEDAASFDLDALVAAAKKEGSVLAYDGSGDVKDVAAAFEKKYGIKAEGVKSKAAATAEKMTREGQAGNVTIDVSLFEDGPMLVGQLLPQKVVTTWIPPDLAKDIGEADRNPLMMILKAYVFAYNPKLSPQGCLVKNIWDLTDPAWKGKVMMQDPLGKEVFTQWFTQLSEKGNDKLAAAYEQLGKGKLDTKEKDAAYEWVKRLAKNDPVLTTEDEDVATGVGAPNQTQKRIGLFSISKFRDLEDKNFNMKVCEGLNPWVGFGYPKFATIATKSKHPNAAKLFVHFAMSKEGFDLESASGGVSGNKAVGQSPANPPGLTDWNTQLYRFSSDQLLADFRSRQDIKDFWRVNHS